MLKLDIKHFSYNIDMKNSKILIKLILNISLKE